MPLARLPRPPVSMSSASSRGDEETVIAFCCAYHPYRFQCGDMAMIVRVSLPFAYVNNDKTNNDEVMLELGK